MSLSTISPPLSQISSHSSEGSASYVVVSKNSCGDSIQSPCSSQSEPSQASADSRSTALQPGSPVSQDKLIVRVQNLTKENEELRCVLLQNNTLLQEYFQDLAGMQKSQKQTNETLRNGYDHARDVVKKLREKSANLKSELKNAQEKITLLEEQVKLKEGEYKEVVHVEGGPYQQNENDSSQVELIQRLESEKNMLQANNSKLQEHISVLRAIREAEPDVDFDDKCETLKCVDSLVSLSSDLQPSLTERQPSDPPSLEEMQDRLNKTITEKEILKVDFERLQIEKEQTQQQCRHLQEEHNNALTELQDENNKLSKVVTAMKEKEAAGVGQTAVTEEVAELSRQLEVEKENFVKLEAELYLVKQERDTHIMKVEELGIENETSTKLRDELDLIKQERETYVKKAEELETENEKSTRLKDELDLLKQERETYMKKVEDLEQARESEEREEIQAMKVQLLKYQNQEKEIVEAANKQALCQNQLTQEVGELKQQLEAEREALGKLQEDLDLLTQERDVYKTKTEEFETRLEEAKKSAEAFGLVEDLVMKEKLDQMKQIKQQLWHYQNREGELLNKENHLLEKEEAFKQFSQGRESFQLQLEEALKREELLQQEGREREEEVESLKSQLIAMSTQLNGAHDHEQQANFMREELQKTGSELAAVQSREEHLRAQVLQLIQENQTLEAEHERVVDEASQKDEMYQGHLNKVAEESAAHRKQRDDVIANLRSHLTSMDGELGKSHKLQDVYRRDRDDIVAQHEQLVAEYDDLLKSFQSTVNANKQRHDDTHMEVNEIKQQLTRAEHELTRADEAIRKKKEDCSLLEDDLGRLREEMFELKQHVEQVPILKTQLEVYQSDFQVEREAREKQHEELLNLREQLQRYQDAEIDEHNNTQMAEMQRRHGSYTSSPAPPEAGQVPGGWFEGLQGVLFSRGTNEPSGVPANVEGPPPGAEPRAVQQEEQHPAPEEEEDWVCPTCRNVFPNFDSLQVHAVECNAAQVGAGRAARHSAQFECPQCLRAFPDYDTLEIHVAECLDPE